MNKKRVLYFCLTVMMAVIIFLFSSQESKKSNNLSYSIDIKIFNWISKGKTEETSSDSESISNNATAVDVAGKEDVSDSQEKADRIEPQVKEDETKYPVNDERFHNIDTVVRKTAHVTLYALFAIPLALFVKTYRVKSWKVILIVLVVGFLYACLDEFNQKIRGTRSGLFSDCLIDTAGCLIGIALVSAREWIGKKREKKERE